jgi:hypothetical protein
MARLGGLYEGHGTGFGPDSPSRRGVGSGIDWGRTKGPKGGDIGLVAI